MEDAILRTLQANGYRAGSKLFIQSFSDATLRSLHAKQQAQRLAYPLVQLGYAAVGADGVARIRVNGSAGPQELALPEVARYSAGVGVSISNKTYPLTQAFIDQAHAAGLQVHGWTFARPDATLAGAEFRQFLGMGMDALFANYPDLAVAARNGFAAQR
ncbi:glycerophosphodiester phosphodiesterase family protein [Stenotrophomonas sp. YIM B06876]|uniref:glycerophosphodiester phosphodiesterase family protein n=1 Tax=Stenotrophomonas sp. YIM B06876 TaxID=3060211 RepID=UPI002738E3C5|nr:glycerophosphodiester phosphodiesterase family protein [Stenotrophomonas sp. YIM B06876]